MLAGALVLTGAPAGVSAADVEAGRRKAEPCAACHGPGGHSRNPLAPSLAAQPLFYLHWQLILFRDQRRKDPQMSPFAATLSDADMGDLAAYYTAQPPAPPPSPGAPDPETVAAGEGLARAHHCSSCHAPTFAGQQYAPRLRGLAYEYLLKQLRGFKAQTRGELDGSMTTAAQPLSGEDIERLARYLGTLPAQP